MVARGVITSYGNMGLPTLVWRPSFSGSRSQFQLELPLPPCRIFAGEEEKKKDEKFGDE